MPIVDHSAYGETPVNVRLLPNLLLIVAIIAAISGGVVFLFRQSPARPIEITLPKATELKAYVSGAVANPGVYSLQEGDRLVDAIEAAGGTTAEADLERVNLAERVRDEGQYHIPRVGETEPTPVLGSDTGKLDLNTASVRELEDLPNIGETRARAIIQYREERGGFSSVAELTSVPGIGSGILESIKDLVVAR